MTIWKHVYDPWFHQTLCRNAVGAQLPAVPIQIRPSAGGRPRLRNPDHWARYLRKSVGTIGIRRGHHQLEPDIKNRINRRRDGFQATPEVQIDLKDFRIPPAHFSDPLFGANESEGDDDRFLAQRRFPGANQPINLLPALTEDLAKDTADQVPERLTQVA